MNFSFKLRYLISSARNYLDAKRFSCPSCGSTQSTVLDRKFAIVSLRRCADCQLQFRAPTTSEKENAEFYQERYDQGFTTEMPSESALSQLLGSSFKGSAKDYSTYIDVLRALKIPPTARILDFGCSWGYGSWQLAAAGFHVEGFEISKPRCAFARSKLGITAFENLDELQPPFDCIFSAHVIEHVPSVREMIDFAIGALRPSGLFISFTPNGCAANRRLEPSNWHKRWGFVHPQLLDEQFCRRTMNNGKYLLASAPFDLNAIGGWDQKAPRELSLVGDELLIALIK